MSNEVIALLIFAGLLAINIIVIIKTLKHISGIEIDLDLEEHREIRPEVHDTKRTK